MNTNQTARLPIRMIWSAILCAALPAWSWSANITNTASGAYKDTTGASYTATTNAAVATIISPPVMTMSKSVSPTSAKSGDTLTFTISYQNTGGSNATNFSITDVIPAGSTFVTGSITGGGTLAGTTITWNIGNVTAGAAVQSVSFQVKVN